MNEYAHLQTAANICRSEAASFHARRDMASGNHEQAKQDFIQAALHIILAGHCASDGSLADLARHAESVRRTSQERHEAVQAESAA